eukprot:475705-Alexandrium_andersonii.AAC.1
MSPRTRAGELANGGVGELGVQEAAAFLALGLQLAGPRRVRRKEGGAEPEEHAEDELLVGQLDRGPGHANAEGPTDRPLLAPDAPELLPVDDEGLEGLLLRHLRELTHLDGWLGGAD